MARKIKGGQVTSIKKLRANMKRSAGGSYDTIPEDGSLMVRFMTEPDGWVEYLEHYDKVRGFFPCSDDCPGCDEGDRPKQRYLANVVDVDESKVLALKMTKTLASSILKRYDKYGTLLDRDYEVSRTGSGMDTEYDSVPEPPSRMNLGRYEEKDLWGIIESQLPSDDDDDDDDDDTPPARGSRKGSAPARRRRRTTDDDDTPDDDDQDDDDDAEDEPPARRRSKRPIKKAPAKKAASSPRRTMRRR